MEVVSTPFVFVVGLDVEKAEQRSILVYLPFLLAEQSFAVSQDGTALYYGAERAESNIWSMERDR